MKQNISIKFLLLGTFLIAGCASPKLTGKFDGQTYTSAQKDYSVPIPVTSGGRVVGDDERGVTFQDDMGMRVSFYSLRIESGSRMMTTLESQGHREALEQCLKALYRDVEPLNYHPEIKSGTISFLFFKDEGTNEKRKTSGAAFIHANRIYLVEYRLPDATKALWHGTDQEQNQMLEKRATELVQTIQTK